MPRDEPVHLYPMTQSYDSIFGCGPHVMGILNVTPDSFSDGGKFFNPDKAIAHGLSLVQQGAHIIDIGGESSRPGALPVDPAQEIARVVPVLEGLRGKAPFLSIDTRNAATMRAALAAGANVVNDISGLRHDAESANVVAQAKVPVIIMHMQGNPQTMQNNPIYNNVVEDIFDFFVERLKFCETHRIDPNLIFLDPGIGFGKTLEHNLLILRNIKRFQDIGRPLVLGVSRKRCIAELSGCNEENSRLAGSIAGAMWCISQGAHIIRVHDVKETLQALKVFTALSSSDHKAV